MQIHLPGTASSYTCSAGSVFLNFLQMIKGGLTDIAKFPTNIFNTNIEHNCDIHNREKKSSLFHLIVLYTTDLHVKLATQNYLQIEPHRK
jgi:hypothetical protein